MIFRKIKSKSRDYNPQFFGIENYIKKTNTQMGTRLTYLKTQTSADDHDQSFDSHCCRFILNLLHLVDSPYLTSSPSLKLLDTPIENKSVRPCRYDGIYVRKAIPSLQHQKRTRPNFCPPFQFRSKRIWNFNIYSENNNSEV